MTAMWTNPTFMYPEILPTGGFFKIGDLKKDRARIKFTEAEDWFVYIIETLRSMSYPHGDGFHQERNAAQKIHSIANMLFVDNMRPYVNIVLSFIKQVIQDLSVKHVVNNLSNLIMQITSSVVPML